MKKVSRIEYCASFEPLQSGMGQDGESKILFPTKKYITRQNGIVLDGPYNTDFPNESSFSACVCRDCRKITLTY